MTGAIGGTPAMRPQQPVGLMPDGMLGVQTAAAAGIIGFDARSAFDRAWESNIIPPQVKPRPPMHALQLAGNTELVRQVNELLYSPKASPTDVLAVMDLMQAKIMELSINGETMALQDLTRRTEANQKAREKELAAAKEKAELAKKNGEWDKVWNIVKSVASVAASVAMIIAGAALMATGAGAVVGAMMMAYGVYSLVNAGFDLADSIGQAQGKEPSPWRPSIGELAAWIAKEAGADEETQQKWRLGAEIALAVVMLVVTLGASAAASSAKLADAASKGSKLLAIGSRLGQVATLVKGVSDVAQGIRRIEMAKLKYEQAEIKARLDRLQVALTVLQSQMEKSQDLLKLLNETMMSIWDTAAERLKTLNDANRRVWGSGRGNMV